MSLKNAFYKLFILPFKYKEKDDYRAEQYWKDRFKKHGSVLKAVGHESLSEEENLKNYEAAAARLLKVLGELNKDLSDARVLEIGSGMGFYTGKLTGNGVRHFTAMDITDHFFPELQKKYPQVNFIKRDVSTEEIRDKFDLILMIDVVQHIVKPEKFRFAMENVARHLKKGGVFVISGIKPDKAGKQLFYVQSWKQEEVGAALPGLKLSKSLDFKRGGKLLVYEKQ